MLPLRWISRQDMLDKYVARYQDLKCTEHGLPDSEIEGHHKKIMNVFGFEPVKGADAVNPVGDAGAKIAPKAGFSLGFAKAKPHNGPVMHNHNTNETFMPMTGTWRFTWEASPAHMEFVDLGPYDTVSFPPGVPRSFENIVPAPDADEGLLLAIVQDDAPISEAMPGVKQLLMSVAKGDLPMLKSAEGPEILLTTKDGGFGG